MTIKSTSIGRAINVVGSYMTEVDFKGKLAVNGLVCQSFTSLMFLGKFSFERIPKPWRQKFPMARIFLKISLLREGIKIEGFVQFQFANVGSSFKVCNLFLKKNDVYLKGLLIFRLFPLTRSAHFFKKSILFQEYFPIRIASIR